MRGVDRHITPPSSAPQIATTASTERENNTATRCPACAVANQQVRQPVSRLVQLTVRPRLLTANQRHGLGWRPPARQTPPESTPQPSRRINTARFAHPSRRASSVPSSKSIDDNRREGSAVIAANTHSNRLTKSRTR
ncbi:hypothetical protein I552_0122 [Mycobacterium xenopi 3993]|nr:hypothetical protein I552_0122 [Mycobacterium xenopi 3993]